MKKVQFIGALLVLWGAFTTSEALAQQASQPYPAVLSSCGTVLYTAGTNAPSTQDTTGKVCTNSAVTVTNASVGANSSTAPTSSTQIGVSDGTNLQPVLAPIFLSDGVNGNNTVSVGSYIWNGTGWDRVRTIAGAVAAGTGTAATALAPTSAAAGAITPIVSAAAEASHVLKAAAGNFYSLTVTTGASAGYVMIDNLTAAPVDGAVTPLMCVSVPATSSVTIGNPGEPPTRYGTGIVAVFSTTGCFTQTASATAFFSAKVQ